MGTIIWQVIFKERMQILSWALKTSPYAEQGGGYFAKYVTLFYTIFLE